MLDRLAGDNRFLRAGIKLAALGLSTILGGGIGIAVDSGYAYYTSYRETGVLLMDNQQNESAPQYDPNSATIFLNGLGHDISCDQALAMEPVVGKFGKNACVIYPSSFSNEPVATKVYDTLFKDADPKATKRAKIVGSSMGDRRALGIAKVLSEKYKVVIEALIINTGPGPLGKVRVKSEFYKSMIENSCGKIPGKLLMALIELFKYSNEGKQLDGAVESGFAYNNRVISDQMCSLDTPLDLQAKDVPAIGTAVYMEPENTVNDVIVDDDGAARDWGELLPNLQVMKVGGNVTHDNISYRPEVFRPIFEDLYNAIREKRLYTEQLIKTAKAR